MFEARGGAFVAIALAAGPRVLGPAPKRLTDLSVEFAFADLERCTGGFCHAVGEGAFGVVFRGDIDGTKAREKKNLAAPPLAMDECAALRRRWR